MRIKKWASRIVTLRDDASRYIAMAHNAIGADAAIFTTRIHVRPPPLRDESHYSCDGNVTTS